MKTIAKYLGLFVLLLAWHIESYAITVPKNEINSYYTEEDCYVDEPNDPSIDRRWRDEQQDDYDAEETRRTRAVSL